MKSALNGLFMIDGHADTVQRFEASWNFADELAGGMLNLESARRGGLSAEIFAIWVDPAEWPGRFAARSRELLHAMHDQVALYPDDLALCLSSRALRDAHAAGRFGVLLSIEGGHAIEDDLAVLEEYYRAGVRAMTLTWSHSVGWAGSSGDGGGGLTAFGREVVACMNRLGMIVDVSHVSDETFWAVLETSTAPVMASHSSARALTAAPRNLSDEQLRALRDRDGLVMVNFFPAFLDEAWRTAWNAGKAERRAVLERVAAPYRQRGEAVPFAVSDAVDREFAARLPRVPLDRLLDHFMHVLALAGPRCVGIGSDFDGIPALPEGMESAADLLLIVEGLDRRGVSEGELAGLLGENFLRVFGAVEAVAR